MYKIYAIKGSTNKLIYNDATPELTTTKLVDPKLSLQDNAAGSSTFKIPQGNAIYSSIEPMITYIRVTRDGEWLWTGRVLTIKTDFWLQKEITTEGALAYLNDVACRQRKLSNVNTRAYVENLLAEYNGRVPEIRRIFPGSISISTNSGSPIGLRDYVIEGESTLKYISTLAEDWGLHIRIRESTVDGHLYLDLLNDSGLPTSSQSIDFGKNLLDYTDETDWSDLITVIHPYGKELETYQATNDEEHPDRLTIKGKTPSDTNTFGVYNDEYLYNKAAVDKFGRIEETVEWSDVEDADTLMRLSELYLSDFQYSSIKLTLKVVDLHYLTGSTQGFKFLSNVVCKSKPHNLSDTFLIDKMEIPFDKPENTTFTFSRSTMGYYTSDRPTQGFGKGTVSGASINVNGFSRAGVLNQAKRNAINMIMANTSGVVSLNMDSTNDHVESITITNAATKDESRYMWIWDYGGLAFISRSSTDDPWPEATDTNIAITNDGHIVANYITSGVLEVPSPTGQLRPIFSADISSKKVTLGQFTVQDDDLYSKDHYFYTSGKTGIYIGGYDQNNIHYEGISIGYGSQNASGELTLLSSNGMELYTTQNNALGNFVGSITANGVGMHITANDRIYLNLPDIWIHRNSSQGGGYKVGYNGSVYLGDQSIEIVNGLVVGVTSS